ncbi:hypothetical protein [Paraburkholderia sp. BL10I2N1]|uniref:hypothetical protein n=1 Tax=Paraburkholderia sp. BL10I2N1 TaxID=1938796 RepID=UPI001061C75A|nr:hypothetical protein [Paraburkholderia sp. BL10I2N1]TDN70397.1 hypothetical protein B0G77_3870 [Paraburkholderia sp. BL10I2N1]
MTALKKPAVPSVLSLDAQLGRIIGPLKENVELMTGVRPGSPVLTQLSSTASTAQIIAAINTIIQRINAAGA